MGTRVLFLFVLILWQGIFWADIAKISEGQDLPEIQANQTADMKVVFLGIPQEFVDESEFVERANRSVIQFAHPNAMTWNLNISVLFREFAESMVDLLRNDAYRSKGVDYYNISLFDTIISQFEDLAVPKHGYLIMFLWVPCNTSHYSWFHVQERPDLFLGRTDYLTGVPINYWAFPPSFGGIRRALYFDVSEIMEKTPTKEMLTDTSISFFSRSLSDIFPNLLGAEDSRMIEADTQTCKDYHVRILWLNGTGEHLAFNELEDSFEELMPWTDWTITMESKPMDSALNNLIEDLTEELTDPLNYSFVLPNGTHIVMEASRNLRCDFYADSGEHDPLICYFFDHVDDYFDLTDPADKSFIPVVFLQLRNDTAFGHAPQAGVSWFLNNIIIVGFQGSLCTNTGESGNMFLLQILRHEIGHWLSLSHHSSNLELGFPKIICSMRSITNRFCAFCKEARARMSFMSFYNKAARVLAEDETRAEASKDDLEKAPDLFYNWRYTEAIETVFFVLAETPSQDVDQILVVITSIIVGAFILVLLLKKGLRSRP